MNFSKAEIEVLALCGMCKNLPVDGCRNIPQEIISELSFLELIRQSKNGLGYCLTAEGAEILRLAEMNYSQDKIYVSYSDKLVRRLQLAEITSFFWKYGANVFVPSPPADNEIGVFLPSFVLRRQKATNALGNSKLSGFYYSKQSVFVPYYITREMPGIYPTVEINRFRNETLSLKKQPHIIYTGEGDLDELIKTITFHKEKPTKNTSLYFDDAINEFGCPVAIMPLTEDGMRQLRILETPNYRQRIVKNLLGDNYLPPLSAQYDGRNKTENYIIGIDCNIKRFESAVRSNEKTIIFVLPFQAETVQRMVKGTNTRCFILKLADTEKLLGIGRLLPKIDNESFKTEKGNLLHVPLIRQIKTVRR